MHIQNIKVPLFLVLLSGGGALALAADVEPVGENPEIIDEFNQNDEVEVFADAVLVIVN
jgi:hypothetical protein